jgi:MFS family permease
VSVLAVCAAIAQPIAGRLADKQTAGQRSLAGIGLFLTAAGVAAAMIPGIPGLVLAAVGIGTGSGIITPVAFAALAASAQPERLGQTMGSAEIGRELGDAGGPLMVGALATAVSLTAGYGALAVSTAALAIIGQRRMGGGRSMQRPDTTPERGADPR